MYELLRCKVTNFFSQYMLVIEYFFVILQQIYIGVMRTRLLLPLLALLLTGCGEHFITDDDYRAQVKWDFDERAENGLLPRDLAVDTLDMQHREAMEFLYAYMPYSDLANYTPEFFLNQVDYAFRARNEFPWGKSVPEDIFRHFVLVCRVNDENLDSAREVFFNDLKPRLQGLSMKEAALEVNHWCHEKVAYRASDERTAGPLATMRTALGRCGEESTFAVTALRAVGIPARQCYTPRWAHCDDRHAWVEVWVDGEWHYLGACEPESELDMGWFSVPASRAMMVHTKAFGRYHGDEEVVRTTSLYTELNLLSHYAKTRRITAVALSADGKPLKGVSVRFKLYNYSEFFTIAESVSNEKGEASVTTGYGDLFVWVTDGKTKYGYSKIDVRKSDRVKVYMNRTADDMFVEQVMMVPPAPDSTCLKEVSPSAYDANSRRLLEEDSIRNSYIATFVNASNLDQWFDVNENLSRAQALELFVKAEGNYRELAHFINTHTTYCEGLFLYDYLKSYSDKDLREVTFATLEHHLTLYDGTIPEDVYKTGIMPARISNELITEWRGLGEFVEPAVDDTGNYYNCPMSPLGVERMKVADKHSRDIYYVAAMRANGTPAYIDQATGAIHVYYGEAWCTLKQRDDKTKTIKMNIETNGKSYYSDYTIQRFENGDFVTLDYDGDAAIKHPVAHLTVPEGLYCFSQGKRNDSGAVLANMDIFRPESGLQYELVTRDKIAIIRVRIKLGSLGEPSKHLVQEIMDNIGKFEKLKGRIIIDVVNPYAPELAGLREHFKISQGVAVRGYQYPIVDIVLKNRPTLHYQGYQINMFGNLLD